MSIDINAETYYELDFVKECLDEQGIVVEENRIQNWGDEADREIDTLLWYLFDAADFPLTEAKMIAAGFTANDFQKLQKLSNQCTIAKYWFYTNGETALKDAADHSMEEFRDKLTQIPATTE